MSNHEPIPRMALDRAEGLAGQSSRLAPRVTAHVNPWRLRQPRTRENLGRRSEMTLDPLAKFDVAPLAHHGRVSPLVPAIPPRRVATRRRL
jgi:hypothetical protein